MHVYIVGMNTGDLQIQCNTYKFFKQISPLRFKIYNSISTYILLYDAVLSDRRTCYQHVHVAYILYRYILVRAQLTLANCKLFVFLVFDHPLKNKKTNTEIVRTSP